MLPPKNIADGLGFNPQRLWHFFRQKKGLWKIGGFSPFNGKVGCELINPGWLFDIGDYTTQLYGDCHKPIYGSLKSNQYNGMSKGFLTLLKWGDKKFKQPFFTRTKNLWNSWRLYFPETNQVQAPENRPKSSHFGSYETSTPTESSFRGPVSCSDIFSSKSEESWSEMTE